MKKLLSLLLIMTLLVPSVSVIPAFAGEHEISVAAESVTAIRIFDMFIVLLDYF